MALKLAATPPQSLPANSHKNNYILLPDANFSNIWIAAIFVYGAVYKTPPIYRKGMDIPRQPLSAARQCKCKSSLNDAAATIRMYHDVIKDLTHSLKFPPCDSPAWEAAMNKALAHEDIQPDDKVLIDMAFEMAATPPSNLPGWYQDALPPSDFSCVWMAANRPWVHNGNQYRPFPRQRLLLSLNPLQKIQIPRPPQNPLQVFLPQMLSKRSPLASPTFPRNNGRCPLPKPLKRFPHPRPILTLSSISLLLLNTLHNTVRK